MRVRAGIAGGLLVCALALLGSASAAPTPSPHSGTMLGVIKRSGSPSAPAGRPHAASRLDGFPIDPSDPLVFHGGPVMKTQKMYLIFWAPSGFSFPAGYESAIQQFAQDVAASPGTTSNAYGAIQQYGVNDVFSYGGSVDDSDPFPTTDCPTDPAMNGGTVCLLDQDLVDEIASVETAEGWSGGYVDQFALVLPPGVDTCWDQAGSTCSYNVFCAYHSWYTYPGSTPNMYLSLPYEVPSATECHTTDGSSVQPEPNGGADVLISAMSHEEREAADDPRGTAWFDVNGNESDDKCAYVYGSQIGNNNGTDFNQLIDGDFYETQTEWSNKLMGCYQVGPPTVTSLSATSANAGDSVFISGTNFFSPEGSDPNVLFNGVTSSFVAIMSPTQLVATVPAGMHPGKVTVQALGGTATSAQTFGQIPAITSLTDTLGNPDTDDVTGTTIVVHGSGFFGVTSVKFNGATAAFTSVATDGSSLRAAVPATATTGPVTVATSTGGTSAGVAFTVKPKITSFSPLKAAGGTNVTIVGSGLGGVDEVDFNGDPSSSITVTPTKITAQVPLDATPGPITATNALPDTATSATSFTPLPSITSFTPSDGMAGTTVTIDGGELADATAVKFGTIGVAPSSPTALQVQATVPAGFSSGTISVVTPEGTAVSKQTFAVTKVTGISPASAAAGATITLSGQGLGSATTVDFAGHAGVPVSGTPTAASVKVVVPDDAVAGALTVHTPNASAATTMVFKPLPKITGLSIVDGVAPDPVHVTGTNLLGATTVKFGASAAGNAQNVTATGFDTTVPGGTFSSGAVSVVTPAGTAISTQVFQVTKVTGISPASAAGGATITLTGQGLGSATTVDFQGHPGVPVAGTPTASWVKVVVPNDATAGTLTVHTPNATATSTVSLKPSPRISALSIVDGVAPDVVHVTGTNLLGATTVKFGASAAGNAQNVTATGFDTTVPGGTFSSGAVSVVTPAGTAISTQVFQVTKVTGVSPASAAAGATITLTGQGLSDVQTVDFIGHGGVVPTSTTASSVKVVVPTDATSGLLTVDTPNATAMSTVVFKPLPKITALSIVDGMSPDPVHVTGTNLLGATTVKFGATAAGSAQNVTATGFDTTVPGAPFSSGAVSVVTPAGTAVSAQVFQVTKVAGVSPASAAAGTTITITGQGLTDTQTVDFNGHGGVVPTSTSATTIKVVVPPDATDGALTVHTPNALVSTTTFKPLPRITSVDQATYEAGDTVTVTGTNLAVSGPTPTGKLGAVAVSPVSVTATSFQFTIPDNAVTGAVSYTDGAGTTTSAANLVRVVPTIDEPLGLPPGAAGAKITLTGQTFTGTTRVTFGSDTNSAPFVVGTGGASLTVTIPATAASGPISVTNAGGTTATTEDFTITPVIKSFAPTTAAVGATIAVNGTGFVGATQVDFGGGVSAVPTNVTATSLKVVVPQGAASGQLRVETSSAGASPLSPTSLTVTASLQGFSPAGGVPGTSVTITGTGFTGVTGVSFGGTAATTFHVASSTQITATVPNGASDGFVTVTRPTAPTALTSATEFFVPTISGFLASTVSPGGDLEIDGTDLAGATDVTFTGGVQAVPTSATNGAVHVTVPVGAQSGPVTVSTPSYGDVTSPASVTIQLTLQITLTGGSAGDEVTSDVGGIACFGDGSGTCVATIDQGTTVTLTAIPAGSDTFTSWSAPPTFTPDNSTTPATFTMNGDYSIQATFAP